MTQPYQPQPGQQPYQPQPAPAEPPKKPNPLTSKPVIGIAALVVGLVLGSMAGGSGKASSSSVAAAAPTVTVTATETATYEADDTSDDGGTDDATTTSSSPTKDDFVIKLKVTSKQCFGSAGCNVTTKASVSYVGSGSTDDLPSYIDITYKIKGAEDPYTATIQMEDGQYTPDTAILSTRRSSAKLTAVVTAVESS